MNIKIQYNQTLEYFSDSLNEFKKKEFILKEAPKKEKTRISEEVNILRKRDDIFRAYKVTQTSVLAIKDKMVKQDLINNDEVEIYLDESMLIGNSKTSDEDSEEEIITKIVTNANGMKSLVTTKGKEIISVVKLDIKTNLDEKN